MADVARLRVRYGHVRARTESLTEPLGPEDQVVQSMPDCSPTKWHRAHTSWFFEEFLLGPFLKGYSPVDPAYRFLFNSYYEAVGPRQPRPRRGMITRPTVDDVARYRCRIDDAMNTLLRDEASWSDDVDFLVDLGTHHEEQHQELILMDAKHLLHQNPLRPAYRDCPPTPTSDPGALRWIPHAGGLTEIGHAGPGFAFDNEGPRHSVWLEPFALGDRLVTCGEWLDFIDDGGYCRPELWLSDGWAAIDEKHWDAPLYWDRDGPGWSIFTLTGQRRLDPSEPVVHVSYYEADAYARWAGHRLATESEWEAVASGADMSWAGAFGSGLHPSAAEPRRPDGVATQLLTSVWQWTASPYVAYPRFRTAPGAVGEYNGKFMVNQQVLRGGCCATPPGHTRTTYRNFYPPSARWAFSGVRLATDG